MAIKWLPGRQVWHTKRPAVKRSAFDQQAIFGIEMLEQRTLLSGTVTVDASLVTASAGASAIYVTQATRPVVATNPTSQTVTTGATVTFTASATGSPTPTVQWQFSTNSGSTFANIGGATSDTYSFVASSSETGYEYRAVFANSAGSVDSGAATLTVTTPNTVANGSFESPTVTGYIYDPTGTGWTFAGNSGIERNGSLWTAPAAPNGTQAAFLQSGAAGVTGTNGSMSQVVDFSATGVYSLQFQAARRSTQAQQIGVYLDGALVGTYSPTSGNSWNTFTASLSILAAGNHTIKFAAINSSGDQSAFVDAVQLSSVAAIANSSFETPAVNGFAYDPTGATWTFAGNSGIERNGSLWDAPAAPDGTQAAFLQSSGAGVTGTNGSISQVVDFGAAGAFTLQFQAAARSSQTQAIGVYLDGTLVGTYTPTSSSSWTTFTASLSITTTGNHTIEFAAMNSTGDQSAFVDAVQLSAAPTIANASFEAPVVGGYVYDPAAASWTFSGNSGIEKNGSLWDAPAAPNGTQAAFLQSGDAGVTGTNGSISEVVNFSTTAVFDLQFQAARRSTQTQEIGVYLDGTLVGTYTASNNSSWNTFTAALDITTIGNHTIEFAAMNSSGDQSAFIDAVQLSAAPELPSIANNSFESPAISTFSYDPTGASWTFTGNSGIERNGSAWDAPTAPNGTQAAFLQSGNAGVTGTNGSISQVVDFGATGVFSLQFLAARRSTQMQEIGVYLDGTLVGTYAPTSNSSWNTFTASLDITTAGNNTIEFAAINSSGDQSAFIDDVQLSA